MLTQYHEADTTFISDLPSYCVSQTLLIYQISAHQHFHPDITDELFVLVAVAKSKDLAARQLTVLSGGGYLLEHKSTIFTVTLTKTLSAAICYCAFSSHLYCHIYFIWVLPM